MASEISRDLAKNAQTIENVFHTDKNADLILRRFDISGTWALVVYIEGMSDAQKINDFVLRQAMDGEQNKEGDIAGLFLRCIAISGAKTKTNMDEVIDDILSGQSALFVDGSSSALVMETRGYEKRAVSPPNSEDVILGSQEGFTESIRTNITLIRKMVRSADLVSEMLLVGDKNKCACAVVYIEGTALSGVADKLKERLKNINVDIIPGAGFMNQLIEDSRFSIVPQSVMTQRPDRCASFLLEGQVLLLTDGAPFALAVPATLFHMLNTPDDTFMRWQYGTFTRCVRFAGFLLALFLPAVYLAMAMYHQELLPHELLMTIAASRADVPFSIITEVILMEFAFLIVDQAGTRIPRLLGSALGIFGALILGQAAVEAKLVSPILIIVVAITALGTYTIPDYSLSRAVQMLRFVYILGASLGGFFGIAVLVFLTLAPISLTQSFGIPFFAPISPPMGHNPDIIIRRPIKRQSANGSIFTKRRGKA